MEVFELRRPEQITGGHTPSASVVSQDGQFLHGSHEMYEGDSGIEAREQALLAEAGPSVAAQMLAVLANAAYQNALDYGRASFQERHTRGDREVMKDLDGLFQANARSASLALTALRAFRQTSSPTFNFKTPSVSINANLSRPDPVSPNRR